MLKRLHVDNVRCLTNFDLKPGPVAAIVGGNGTGKSTVFEVLRALRDFLTLGGTVHDYFAPTSLTRWDTRLEQHIELEVTAPDASLYGYELEVRHDPQSRDAIVVRETLTADGDLLYRSTGGEVQLFGDDARKAPRAAFPFAPKRSFLPVLEARPDNQRIMAFKQWLAGMWAFSLRPQAMEPTSLQESDGVAVTGANFVSWYRTLVQASPDVAERIRQDLSPVIPGLTAIRLLKLGADARFLSLDCELSGKKFGLSLDELSEGQRALLLLYAVLRALASDTPGM